MMGIVTILRMVVTKVLADTKSGSVLNWRENIVVFAAVGMLAKMMRIEPNVGVIGSRDTMANARMGDATIRMITMNDRALRSTFLPPRVASCIPRTTMIVGIVACEIKSIV